MIATKIRNIDSQLSLRDAIVLLVILTVWLLAVGHSVYIHLLTYTVKCSKFGLMHLFYLDFLGENGSR